MIGKKYNYDDIFFRDLTICTLAMLEERLGWVNNFKEKNVNVDIPVYYSLSGHNSSYLLDSFVDDVLGDSRKLEMNTDVIPRAHCTLKSWTMKGEEFANPNVWLRQVVENEDEIRKVLTKVRAIPIQANFEASIILSSELDTFKASEVIMTSLMFYKHMYFEYNFMYIDAVVTFPQENPVELNRELNMGDSDQIKLDFGFEVHTYYPGWGEQQIWGRPKQGKWINQLKQSTSENIDDLDRRDRFSDPDINNGSV